MHQHIFQSFECDVHLKSSCAITDRLFDSLIPLSLSVLDDGEQCECDVFRDSDHRRV